LISLHCAFVRSFHPSICLCEIRVPNQSIDHRSIDAQEAFRVHGGFAWLVATLSGTLYACVLTR
jgi:hypothetical protein